MRERLTPEEFRGGDEPRRQGFRGFVERISPQKKIEGKGEEKEKEQHFIQEFERGDLIIQKHYASEEETHKDVREVLDIKLINKRGETCSLKDELFRKGKFIEEKGIGMRGGETRAKWSVRWRVLLPTLERKVHFPESYLRMSESNKKMSLKDLLTRKDFLKEKKGAFLELFHEIKHAHVLEFRPKSVKRYTERMDLINRAAHEILTEKEKERYEELVLGEERLCWAFALRKIRELRRKGFDAEPSLDDPRRLREYFRSLLHTYVELVEAPS